MSHAALYNLWSNQNSCKERYWWSTACWMGYQQALTYSWGLKDCTTHVCFGLWQPIIKTRMSWAGCLVSLMNVALSILFNSSYTFQSAKWAGQRGGPIRVWVQCPVPGGKRRSLGHDLVDCQTSIWQTGLCLQRQARAVSWCSRQLHAVLKLVLQAVWIQNCQPIQKTGQSKVWRAILWKKVKLLIVKEIF